MKSVGGVFLFGVWRIFFMFKAVLETVFVSAKWAEKYYVMRLEAGGDYSFAHL